MQKIVALLFALLIATMIYSYLSPQADLPGISFGARQEGFVNQAAVPSSQTLASCLLRASLVYRVPTDVVIGVMYVEGGRMGQAVGPNVNGTYDLGLMQINTLWIPKLAKLWQVDYRTAYNAVRDGGCENIYVGVWLLKRSIAATGSLYGGIAYYHSATPGLGSAYANKVEGTMRRKGLSLH